MKWSFDSLLAYCTTNKRPAFHLESRPYDTGYNDLEDCRYRCPVLLVLLCLNSYSPPFHQGQAFRACPALDAGSELHYSVVKVLWFTILIIQQKELLCINRMNLYLRENPQDGIMPCVRGGAAGVELIGESLCVCSSSYRRERRAGLPRLYRGQFYQRWSDGNTCEVGLVGSYPGKLISLPCRRVLPKPAFECSRSKQRRNDSDSH